MNASLKCTTMLANITRSIIICLMYILELNDTQRELQDLSRKFTKEEIIPVAAEYDRSGKYPWEIVKKAWSLGLLNKHVPPHCGIFIDFYHLMKKLN